MDTRLFIADQKGVNYDEAREVCARCSVTTECARYALTTGTTLGIFGGMTRPERREWAKAQATTTTPARSLAYSTPTTW